LSSTRQANHHHIRPAGERAGQPLNRVFERYRVQHNKLIVGLDDEDVRQMIETKVAGNDPAELIRQKIEDVRLGI
jgi:hypothetical protein